MYKYLIFSTVLLFLFSCQKDPCENLTCLNGGTCVDGDCDCPDGFIGPDCGLELDPCLQRPCESNGTESCVVGPDGSARCECKLGYEGDFCETQWEAKFVGNYISSEACNGITLGYTLQVDPGPNPRQITFINFNDQASDSTTAKVVANLINGTVFEIYEQFMPFGRVTGAGSINEDGDITWNFEIIQPTDTINCSGILQPN